MRNVRWLWIVIGGFVAEVVGFLVLIGIRLLHGYGPLEITPLSPVGRFAFMAELFLVMALFGWWVGRRARGLVVLNGLLVGVAAVVIYEIAASRAPVPVPHDFSYFLAHAVKIAGAAAGGIFAARRSGSTAAGMA